jgi:nucleolar MIF4G domain-containing protein 1
LLNRLAESNLQPLVTECASLHETNRRVVASAVVRGLLSAAAGGPRASAAFACVAACFVAGLAAQARAQDVGAAFLEALAQRLDAAAALQRAQEAQEARRRKKKGGKSSSADADADNAAALVLLRAAEAHAAEVGGVGANPGVARRNLTMLLAYLYSCGLVGADVLFSYLMEGLLRPAGPAGAASGLGGADAAATPHPLGDGDADAMVTLLSAVGLQLRAADPVRMKDFVLAVHARVAEAAAAAAARAADGDADADAADDKKEDDGEDDDGGGNSTLGVSRRARLMLDLVLDIKNNRRRDAGRPGRGGGGAAAVVGAASLRWLRAQGVAEVALGGPCVAWRRLVRPDKRGHWWLPGAAGGTGDFLRDEEGEEGGGGGGGGNDPFSSKLPPGFVGGKLVLGKRSAALAGGDPLLAAALGAGDGDSSGFEEDDEDEGAKGGNTNTTTAATATDPASLLRLAARAKMADTPARRAAFLAVAGASDLQDAQQRLVRRQRRPRRPRRARPRGRARRARLLPARARLQPLLRGPRGAPRLRGQAAAPVAAVCAVGCDAARRGGAEAEAARRRRTWRRLCRFGRGRRRRRQRIPRPRRPRAGPPGALRGRARRAPAQRLVGRRGHAPRRRRLGGRRRGRRARAERC